MLFFIDEFKCKTSPKLKTKHMHMKAKVILKRMAHSAGATNETKESQPTNRVAGKIRPNAREFLRIFFL